MMRAIRVLWAPILIILGGSISFSCSGAPAIPPVTAPRAVSLAVAQSWWAGSSLMFPEYLVDERTHFSVSVSIGDGDSHVRYRDLATKVELDPGDGSGWLDITAGYLGTMGTDEPDGSHVYSEPGEYTVQAHVTYWDGEVVVSDPRTLIVAPAVE